MITSKNSTRTSKGNEYTPPDHGSGESTNSVKNKENENTNLSEVFFLFRKLVNCQQKENGLIFGSILQGEGKKLSNEFNHDSQERKGKLKSVHPTSDIHYSKKGTDILVCGKSVGKENNQELAETGFISTRKIRNRRVNNDENSLRKRPPFPFPVKNEIHSTSESRNEEIVLGRRRKVLSETTNTFQHCNRNEVTGKWKCPQKSKPNLGPPLKQLRLEQWLRRI